MNKLYKLPPPSSIDQSECASIGLRIKEHVDVDHFPYTFMKDMDPKDVYYWAWARNHSFPREVFGDDWDTLGLGT